jgi:MoaA/NifB/PqqE/SkfB family radical SAM enzyme
MYNFDEIKMVHAEITGKCNARCPMCSRYDKQGYLHPDIEETHLSTELFYKFFGDDFVKQLDHVYFSGVYGDPCIHPNLLEFCQYLIKHNIKVKVDTNAGYRKPEFWSKLATAGVHINFAVDGLRDTNHLYRRGVDWNIVEANMQAFSQAGGQAQWNYIVFEHNEKDLPAAQQLAKELNFDFRIKITQKFKKFKSWHVMQDGVKQFEIAPPTTDLYRHPNIGKQEYSTTENNLTDFSLQRYKKFDNLEISCKSLDRKELFLNYQGYVVPCCYLGTFYGPSANAHQFKQYDLDKFNLCNHTLVDIVRNLSVIKDSWTKTTADGKLITCSHTCGKNQQQTTQFIGID